MLICTFASPRECKPGAEPTPLTYNVADVLLGLYVSTLMIGAVAFFHPFALPQTVYLFRPQCEMMYLDLLQLHVLVGWYAGGILPGWGK